MSFWSQGNAICTPYVDDLLSKEDVSLTEVMDQSVVLQECKSQNKTLIDYLSRNDVLRELIHIATWEPTGEAVDPMKYKYANIACELLTSEVPMITQTLASDPNLLNELYAFLEADPPLNPLLASFFSRIVAVLVSKTSEQNWFSYQVTCLQVLEFIKNKGNGVALFLRHMGTSAIMDLVHKIYIKIEGVEMKSNFLNWLHEGDFIERLIEMVGPGVSDDVRTNACQLLCDFIVSSREICQESNDQPEPDLLAQKIESEEMVNKLISVMLTEPRSNSSIVGGISVLLTLLRSSRRDYNDQLYSIMPSIESVNTIAGAIIPQLPQILHVLHNPPYKAPVKTTVGVLEKPLGASRVELARLLAVLTATGHELLLSEIQRHDLLNVLLDLFFEYPWNNFLHTQVEAMVEAVLSFEAFAVHALSNCRLIQRIVTAWKDNDAQQKDLKPRRGYMGHLIRISNRVVETAAKPSLQSALPTLVDADALSQWNEFVTTDLAKVNGDQTTRIMEIKQEENDGEVIVHELYRRYYQMQAVAAPFPENFQDGQFGGNGSNGGLGSLTKPDFPDDDSDEDIQTQTSLFEQVCGQRLQTLDDDDDWFSKVMQRSSSDQRDTRAWNDEGSSDEEEPSNTGDDDIDDWPDTQLQVPPLEQSNPWSSDVLSASSPDQGWANFETSPFLANFGFDLSSTIATSNPGDIERVPFDLTPTEPKMFPLADASPAPAETPPTDIDTLSAGKDDPPETSANSSMEIAEILDYNSSAQLMEFSDLVEHVRGMELEGPLSACDETSASSNISSVIAAFPSETVITQTEAALPSNIPSDSEPSEVATQIAQLLAEVTEAVANIAVESPAVSSSINSSAINETMNATENSIEPNPSAILESSVQQVDTRSPIITEVPVVLENSSSGSDTELRTESEPELSNGPVSAVDPDSITNIALVPISDFLSNERFPKDTNQPCAAPIDGSEQISDLSKSKLAAENEDVPSPNGPVTTI